MLDFLKHCCGKTTEVLLNYSVVGNQMFHDLMKPFFSPGAYYNHPVLLQLLYLEQAW